MADVKNTDKIIVTNVAALKTKYGTSGWSKIDQRIKALIAADDRRGVNARLIDVSNKQHMSRCGAEKLPPPDSDNQIKSAIDKQTKDTIDKIVQTYEPHYLLLLGSTDVIPHQNLINPLFDHKGDVDEFVPSDLPYACEHSYSSDIEDFLKIERVVGRLPDVTAANDPAGLTSLLKIAEAAKPRERSAFETYLGISCADWKDSTSDTLRDIFKSQAELNCAPTAGPDWRDAQMASRFHYLNCHGKDDAANIFGQLNESFSVALKSNLVTGKISDGTIVVSECCYGAKLFQPSIPGLLPLCNSYLQSSAHGFLGSTNTAYGPSAGTGYADLVCRYFAKSVLNGASLGRALLEARHEFIQQSSTLNAFDLKTLAQFTLLGDPALHPVVTSPVNQVVLTSSRKQGVAAAHEEKRMATRMRRTRSTLRAHSISVGAQPVVTKSKKFSSKKVQLLLSKAAQQHNLTELVHFSYDMSDATKENPHRSHVAIANHTPKGAPGIRLFGIAAHEQHGALEIGFLANK